MESTHFIGMDVSKKTLDLALFNKEGLVQRQDKLGNSEESLRTFFEDIKKTDPTFEFSSTVVCLEHTGIYANILLGYLVKTGANICLESALQIKRSQGIQRGKNDKVDALRIAQYAYRNRQFLRFWIPTRIEVQKLKALLAVRERLIKIAQQLEVPLNEGAMFTDPAIQKLIKQSCQDTIRAIRRSIEKTDLKIERLISQDQTMKRQFELATSVVGVGPVIAANMIVATNEFKCIKEAKKFACYSGVAPFENISGTSVKGRTRVSKLANVNMKKLLNMGAVSAIQYSQELKAYFERKTAGGKNPMVVINAVRNKLISRVFACITNNRPYEKIYKHTFA